MDTPVVNKSGSPVIPKPKPHVSSSHSTAVSLPALSTDTVKLSIKGQSLAEADRVSINNPLPSGIENTKLSVTENNDVVLEVIDPKTKEVVRTVPSEEQLELREAIRNELNKT
jgi:hypothetical protein